jgi:hypothetical protein
MFITKLVIGKSILPKLSINETYMTKTLTSEKPKESDESV